ncbi:hypothetical protein [Enterococcus asini]|uniref:hypothetical protein n=1 Tax=Enterococcus asini TaxID=57732 RepID=UPI001E4502B8|nr:hypothetical protein [Enterococcus asini]
MKYKAKSMMSLNEMARLAIDYEGDGYVTGYPIVSDNDAYILNGVIEANEEYITINQWVPVFPESLTPVSPSLTDDQQVVLEWLKKKIDSYLSVSYLIGNLDYFAATPIGQAWKRLSKAQQFQVLAAFAEWGLSILDN